MFYKLATSITILRSNGVGTYQYDSIYGCSIGSEKVTVGLLPVLLGKFFHCLRAKAAPRALRTHTHMPLKMDRNGTHYSTFSLILLQMNPHGAPRNQLIIINHVLRSLVVFKSAVNMSTTKPFPVGRMNSRQSYCAIRALLPRFRRI